MGSTLLATLAYGIRIIQKRYMMYDILTDYSQKHPTAKLEIAHGGEGYDPMKRQKDFVVIAESRIDVYPWDAFQAVTKSLEIGPDWDRRLKDFCTEKKIKWVQPEWYLMAYYE